MLLDVTSLSQGIKTVGGVMTKYAAIGPRTLVKKCAANFDNILEDTFTYKCDVAHHGVTTRFTDATIKLHIVYPGEYNVHADCVCDFSHDVVGMRSETLNREIAIQCEYTMIPDKLGSCLIQIREYTKAIKFLGQALSEDGSAVSFPFTIFGYTEDRFEEYGIFS